MPQSRTTSNLVLVANEPIKPSVALPETLRIYLATVRAMKANLLLNAGPLDQRKLRPEDERLLMELGQQCLCFPFN